MTTRTTTPHHQDYVKGQQSGAAAAECATGFLGMYVIGKQSAQRDFRE